MCARKQNDVTHHKQETCEMNRAYPNTSRHACGDVMEGKVQDKRKQKRSRINLLDNLKQEATLVIRPEKMCLEDYHSGIEPVSNE